MSWTFTADDGEQVHYDVPPQVARLEAQKTRSQEHYIKLLMEKDAELAALRELVCNLYTLAKHCPSDKIADDFDFCTPLDQAEALLQEKGE